MAQPMTGPMPGRLDRLREAVRRPLPLGYHPLHRFYPGGSLTRAFRGMPERPDDWWSEDWVGSCTRAGNDDPDGRPQGMSLVGLGWELALDMIDYTGADAGPTFARARQQPRVLRVSGASREVRLLHDDVLPYFDATALEVADEIDVSDGRFSIAIVVSGTGTVDGDFGSQPVRRGQTFALPASLPIRVRAGREAVRVIRCLGPAVA